MLLVSRLLIPTPVCGIVLAKGYSRRHHHVAVVATKPADLSRKAGRAVELTEVLCAKIVWATFLARRMGRSAIRMNEVMIYEQYRRFSCFDPYSHIIKNNDLDTQFGPSRAMHTSDYLSRLNQYSFCLYTIQTEIQSPH